MRQSPLHLAELGDQLDLGTGERLDINVDDDGCYLLLWGRVSVVVDGEPCLDLDGGWATSGGPRAYTLLASKPTVVLRITSDRLDELVESTPSLAGSILVRVDRFGHALSTLGSGS